MTLTELREIAERATQGEWTFSASLDKRRHHVAALGGVVCASDPGDEERTRRHHNDHEHIAAFNPQVALALLDCVTELKGALLYLESLGLTASKDEGEPEYHILRDFQRSIKKLKEAGVTI